MTKEAKRIERLSEEAVTDAKAICHEGVNLRYAEAIRSTWHGKWQMAEIEWGALSLTCMVINRGLALMDAAISNKLGVAHQMPHGGLLYPIEQRRVA